MYKFEVDNMNCMSCFHNIEDALKEYDTNILVKADVKNQMITIESTQSVEQLTKLIEQAGYNVKVVVSE